MTPRIYTLINNGTIKVFREDKNGDLKEVGFLAADPAGMPEADLMSLSIMLADLTESSIPVEKAKPVENPAAKEALPKKTKPGKHKRERDMSIPITIPGIPSDPPHQGPTPSVPRVLLLKTLWNTSESYPIGRDILMAALQEPLDKATPKIKLNADSFRRVTDANVKRDLIATGKDFNGRVTVWITPEGRAFLHEHLSSLGYTIDGSGNINQINPAPPWEQGTSIRPYTGDIPHTTNES